MIKIHITNLRCKITGDLKEANKLRNALSFRHPNAWFLRTHMPKGWDGKVQWITENATFKNGLLPKIIEKCKELDIKVELIDNRQFPEFQGLPEVLGKLEARGYQRDAISSLVANKLDDGTPWTLGVINAATNAGKCIGKDVMVLTDKGFEKLPDMVNPKGKIILNEFGKSTIEGWEYCGVIDLLKITMESGLEIEVGYDKHRFKVLSKEGWEWVYVKTLKPGDIIPIKYNTKVFGSSMNNPNIGYLLGCIHGDGHINEGKKGFSITSEPKNIRLLRVLQRTLIKDLDLENVVGRVKLKPDGNFRLSKSHYKLKELFSETPELCNNSHNKTVPKLILQSPEEVQKAYIRGYFDTGGNSSKDGNYKISLTSVNHRGLLEIQLMLLNLGIISRIKPRVTGFINKLGEKVRGKAFRLTLSGIEGYKFMTKIGFGLSSKQSNMDNYKGDYFKESINTLPEIFYPILESFSYYLKYNNRGSRYPIRRWLMRGVKVKIHLIKELLDKHPELSNLKEYSILREATDNLFYDKIVKTEVISGDAWDIEVKDSHSYISNGFISHNTLIAAGIHKSYKKPKTLLLLKSVDLFNQAKKEYPELLPNDDIGFVQGSKNNHWGDFTVAMVQTLSRNIGKFKGYLQNIDIVIVDEADEGTSKQYKTVLNTLYNTTVRVGLSGSIYLSKLKKHELKNFELRSFFSDEIFIITKKEMVKKGFSTNLVIKINGLEPREPLPGDYKKEYDENIIFNEDRNNKIVERISFNINRGRIPLLIICRYHNHVDEVFDYVDRSFGQDFSINKVHHKTLDRETIIEDFREGKIDILIASLIIKRGQNLPLIKCLINAAGGDSEENVIQIMGRAERKHESKNKTIIEDFMDSGHFLKRHSKHRVIYYKKQGFKVIQLY